MKEFDSNNIPLHLLDKAREISNYMDTQGYVTWELGNICSRNFADKVRVYEDYFKFRDESELNKNIGIAKKFLEDL